MAETRADRRAARRALEGGRPASARQPARPVQSEPEHRRSNFIQESYAELRKVEWPGQSQVIQGTVVVLVACLVVGVFLYLNDAVWKHVVGKVFLGQ